MQTCLQINSVGKDFTERDLNNVVLSVRLRGAEAMRFWNVLDSAKERNAYIDKTDVIKELLGLVSATGLTRDEIDYFRHGKKAKDRVEEEETAFSLAEKIDSKPEKKRKAS